MSVEERLEAQHQARMSLVNCAKYIRERDGIIRGARSAGLTVAEIAQLMHMSRQRISMIVNQPRDLGEAGRLDAARAGRPAPIRKG